MVGTGRLWMARGRLWMAVGGRRRRGVLLLSHLMMPGNPSHYTPNGPSAHGPERSSAHGPERSSAHGPERSSAHGDSPSRMVNVVKWVRSGSALAGGPTPLSAARPWSGNSSFSFELPTTLAITRIFTKKGCAQAETVGGCARVHERVVNEEECVANAKVVSILAKKFGIGQWSLIGPSSE